VTVADLDVEDGVELVELPVVACGVFVLWVKVWWLEAVAELDAWGPVATTTPSTTERPAAATTPSLVMVLTPLSAMARVLALRGWR
jgi:hypothetical protein